MKVKSLNIRTLRYHQLYLVCGVVCSNDSDESDGLSVKDDRLPRPTSFRRFVDDSRPVLLIIGHVDVVAVAAAVAVPQQQPDKNRRLHWQGNHVTDFDPGTTFCQTQPNPQLSDVQLATWHKLFST